ncbi:hypothetical protein [Flavobacterium sp.]|uniref:hypothetical protein n=1 Tax=Flavobacterium sp. TaxID=239 RepID=UPI003342161C
MKKRLESELISIAHRILKLKNKSEVDQLYLETRKLYETLAVLKFYGDNYEQVKSEVSQEELEEKLAAEEIIQEEIKEIPVEEVVVAAQEMEEVLEEEVDEDEEIDDEEEIEEEDLDESDEDLEEEEDESDEEDEEDENEEDEDDSEEAEDEEEFENAIHFEPIFELEGSFEESEDEDDNEDKELFEPNTKTVESNKIESRQISFEDLLGESFNEPEFVKPNDVVIPSSLIEVIEEKPLSLNDQHSKAINIGMNDRIAFVKHLFDDSAEDYNRVLSQLNSFTTKEEAIDFIEEIIKPDYENWVGSEEYAERFMEIVKNKFN